MIPHPEISSYIYNGGSVEGNKTQETVAHGLRNFGKSMMMNADLMRLSKRLITSIWYSSFLPF